MGLIDMPEAGVLRLIFARRNAIDHCRKRGAMLQIIACIAVVGFSSTAVAQRPEIALKAGNAKAADLKGRKVTLRYSAEDFGEFFESNSGEGVYEFAVRLTSDMRRFGITRAILPDPYLTDRKEQWLAAARHAATMGFEIRFQIDPASTAGKSSEPNSEKIVGILDADRAKVLESGIVSRVAELSELRSASDSKVISGVFLPLAPPDSLPAGWEAGLNESTFKAFLKDMGLEDDWSGPGKSESLSRLDYIRSRGLMPWLSWRSRRIATFYESIGKEIESRHGLGLTVAAPHPGNVEAHLLYEEAERVGSSPVFAWRWMAFEPDLWRNTGAILLIGAESVSKVQPNRDWAIHPDLQTALGLQSARGHWFAGSRGSDRTDSPHAGTDRGDYEHLLSAMTCHLSRHDSTSLIVDRCALGERHEDFATWVARYEGLPEIGRKSWETDAPKPGLTMRCYGTGDSELLVPINPLPCPIALELVLQRRQGGTVDPVDPDSNLNLVLESSGKERSIAKLTIPPMHVGRLDLGGFRIENYRAELTAESRDVVRTRYDALIRQNAEAVPVNGDGVPPAMTEAETKTRGRRLMAALQAYRDMRLADFFRISDSVTFERRGRRNSEIPADMGRADLPKRRIIR